MELLLCERITLEAIANGSDTLERISKSTGLDISVINNILPTFLMNNMISYKNKSYKLDVKTNPCWMRELSKTESVKHEINDILSASVNLLSEKKSISLRKVYLSEFEEKLLNIELSRVDKLVREISNKKSLNKNVKDMKVIYWGYSDYEDILNTHSA